MYGTIIRKHDCKVGRYMNVVNLKVLTDALFIFQSDVHHMYCTVPDLPPPSAIDDRMYDLLQKHWPSGCYVVKKTNSLDVMISCTAWQCFTFYGLRCCKWLLWDSIVLLLFLIDTRWSLFWKFLTIKDLDSHTSRVNR